MKMVMKPLMMLVCIALFASCKQALTNKDFTNFQEDVFLNYCSSDVRIAEKSLLEGLSLISQYESSGVKGVDYDAARATMHERLFLIYRKTCQTNKMESELQQSIKYITHSRIRWGEQSPPTMSYDEFASRLDWRERNANVAWKTNIYRCK